MGADSVLELSTQALELALRVALPLLLVGLVVGLAVSIFQAVTQIQEQTLAFIPKILAIAGVLIVGGLAAALSAAGSFIDTSIGFSYGSLVDPLTGTQSTVLSQAYSLVGMLIFIAIGGDGWVVQGLARTYDMVGLDQAPALGRLVGGVDAVFGSIFISAIEVAGPVLLALILTDAAFGVVSRVVPQLNVFAVGFPAKIVVGLLLVTATLPFVAGWISSELQQDVGAALQAIRVA